MQRRKIRTRRRELGAALTAALCLAGCGSGAERRAAPQPKLPSTLAAQLAGRSDQVAAALEAGDSCNALDQALRLQHDTIKAINERRIPGPYQEQLVSTVGDLVGRIQCVPPAEHHGKGKAKGKPKHEGDD